MERIKGADILEKEDYFKIILQNYQEPVDFKEYEKVIRKPLDYLEKKPHKTFKIFMNAINYWFKIPKDKYRYVEVMAEQVVSATTTIDDIVDDGKIARGEPAPHTVFGVPATLMCCEYANFNFLKQVIEMNNLDYLKCYVECGINGYKGQAVEIYWRENSICPTFKQLVMLMNAKASVYFIYASKLMQSFSENKRDYSGIMCLMGIFLQFRNDYRNLFMPEDQNNNEIFADDLTEGKHSFPLVHAISTLKNKEVEEILKQRPTDLETKRRCVKIMKEIGTQKYCLEVLNDLADELKMKIRNFDENPILQALIDLARDFNDWE